MLIKNDVLLFNVACCCLGFFV